MFFDQGDGTVLRRYRTDGDCDPGPTLTRCYRTGHPRVTARFLLAQLGAEAWPGTTVGRRCRLPPVSNAAHHADEVPQGLALLPGDLTEEQLLAAPVMVSIDALLIEDLDEDEDEAFAAALSS